MNDKPTITLSKLYHRKTHCIAMFFGFDKTLIDLVKQLTDALWSQTHKVWYLPNNPENLKLIFSTFKGKAHINSEQFFKKPDAREVKQIARVKEERHLTEANKTLLNNFYKYLIGKRYSKSTVDTYVYLVADFIAFYNAKTIESLTNRDVEVFLETVYVKKDFAISTQRQFISAMKLFVAFNPQIDINEFKLERPKKSKILPTVLSSEDIINLLRATKNLKHRAILALIYSAGLRISELLRLELKHINIERKQLIVKSSKGRKDRYVVLADSFMPLLKNYYFTYKPKRYFVEGPDESMYSASSIRKFLAKSCKAAHIYKDVTPHTLRHSYATHLLEHGINLRHIQELLGHSKPETTMIYTHVARKDLLEIKSPLDMAVTTHKKNDNEEQKFLISGN